MTLSASMMTGFLFQSTHSARSATRSTASFRPASRYFNPRTPRGVRPRFSKTVRNDIQISIHALREECDRSLGGQAGGGLLFQSTHSARSATSPPARWSTLSLHFNPRTPRGVRLSNIADSSLATLFQSTHSARSATKISDTEREKMYISIHALREECDAAGWRKFTSWSLFQSTHSARSATLLIFLTINSKNNFNPRTPRGVRPSYRQDNGHKAKISIHALREECDKRLGGRTTDPSDFNPRTPRGVRRAPYQTLYQGKGHFNPRTPRGVRPSGVLPTRSRTLISIHALREECDHKAFGAEKLDAEFQSTHSARSATCQTKAFQYQDGVFQSTHSARSATLR